MADDAAHLAALASAYEAAVAAVGRAAADAHAQIDGDHETVQHLGGSGGTRPPLIAGVPFDDPPPYAPPTSTLSHNALIPDTPLVDSPLSNSSLAFDDAPLWQS
jgi:hypothetical protein